jgi:hypothetical protein
MLRSMTSWKLRALLLPLLLLPDCRRSSPPPTPRPAPRAPDAGTRKLEDGIPYRHFESPGAALSAILAEARPAVIGFGEVHEKKGSPKVRSAISRFGEQLLPALAKQASDLIVETWLTEGRCGAVEKKVVKSVEKVTERPASTEDEVLAVLTRAKALGIAPHILSVGCKDYKLLARSGAAEADPRRSGRDPRNRSGAAEADPRRSGRDPRNSSVDAEALLGMITRHLQGKAEAVLQARAPASAPARSPRSLLALYGGALHNDLYPVEGLDAFSYAAALEKRIGERYIEVDLYVPEYIEKDESLAKEAWFPVFRRHSSSSRTLLLERGERSYILVFPRTAR